MAPPRRGIVLSRRPGGGGGGGAPSGPAGGFLAGTYPDPDAAADALDQIGVSAFAQTVLDDADAAAVIATLGLGQWQDFMPAWTSSGTAPAIGNGTLVGRYVQIGKIVHATVTLVAGSTTTFGTGTYFLSLPVTAAAEVAGGIIGTYRVFDSSAGSHFIGVIYADTTARVLGMSSANPTTLVAQTTPFTWAQSDQFRFSVTYEAA